MRIEKRKRDADAIFVGRITASFSGINPYEAPRGLIHMPTQYADIEHYIDDLPNVLAEAYDAARHGWDNGTTIDMRRATYQVTEVVKQMWLRLAAEFPEGRFGGKPAEQFIEEYIKQRYAWHSALAEPQGPGTGGSIVGILTARGVLGDLETAVVDTVTALRGLGHSQRAAKIWIAYWEAAKERAP